MQRSLIQLNLYGSEAVLHKLENDLKMDFFCFLAIFEFISDSLKTIQVELHQYPLHQSILLTQGPIHKKFQKKNLEVAILKNVVFLSRPFGFFFSKHSFFLFSNENKSKFINQQGWVKLLIKANITALLTQNKHFDKECKKAFIN